MATDPLLRKTLEVFPTFEAAKLSLTPLEKGGSGRKFYRLQAPEHAPIIVAAYTDDRAENARYVGIAEFLKQAGVNVPSVYHHDIAERIIWMQDVGQEDLWTYRQHTWEERQPLYQRALEQAFLLHTRASQAHPHSHIALEPDFDSALYAWEQNYFLEHAVGGLLGNPESVCNALRKAPGFSALQEKLARLPRALVHRDFQSQNIMLSEGNCWLIDFQGLRYGLPQYDIASLLCDPYVTFKPSERAMLLDFYKDLYARHAEPLPENFDEVFWQCAAQRLMQALGAYGNLGLRQGKPQFLSHAPAAWQLLKETVAKVPELDHLTSILPSNP